MSGREGLLAGAIQLFTKSLSSPTFHLTLIDDPRAGPFWGHILRDEESEAPPARGGQARNYRLHISKNAAAFLPQRHSLVKDNRLVIFLGT